MEGFPKSGHIFIGTNLGNIQWIMSYGYKISGGHYPNCPSSSSWEASLQWYTTSICTILIYRLMFTALEVPVMDVRGPINPSRSARITATMHVIPTWRRQVDLHFLHTVLFMQWNRLGLFHRTSFLVGQGKWSISNDVLSNTSLCAPSLLSSPWDKLPDISRVSADADADADADVEKFLALECAIAWSVSLCGDQGVLVQVICWGRTSLTWTWEGCLRRRRAWHILLPWTCCMCIHPVAHYHP